MDTFQKSNNKSCVFFIQGKFSSDGKQRSNSTKVEEEKRELSASHDRIELEQNGWSFDCRLFMCFSCKSQQRGTDV